MQVEKPFPPSPSIYSSNTFGKIWVFSGQVAQPAATLLQSIHTQGYPWGLRGEVEPQQSFVDFGGKELLQPGWLRALQLQVELRIERKVGPDAFVRYYHEGGGSCASREHASNPDDPTVFVTIGAPCHLAYVNVLTGELTVLPLASGSIVVYDGVFNVHHYLKILNTQSKTSKGARFCIRWTFPRNEAKWAMPEGQELAKLWKEYQMGTKVNELKARLSSVEPWKVRPFSPMVPDELRQGQVALFQSVPPHPSSKARGDERDSKRRRVESASF